MYFLHLLSVLVLVIYCNQILAFHGFLLFLLLFLQYQYSLFLKTIVDIVLSFNVSVRRTSKTCLDVQHAFLLWFILEKWHYDNVGLNPSECSFFNHPDFDSQKFTDEHFKVCIIAQTYVEDSRIDRLRFSLYFDKSIDYLLANNFKTCDIALKLHPRSNVDLYHKYELKTFRYGVIPDADVYITGWSSLGIAVFS